MGAGFDKIGSLGSVKNGNKSRALKEMALPTIFSQIIILIYNMADTFYLGRTNNPYMVAGASLILPVFNICLSLGRADRNRRGSADFTASG